MLPEVTLCFDLLSFNFRTSPTSEHKPQKGQFCFSFARIPSTWCSFRIIQVEVFPPGKRPEKYQRLPQGGSIAQSMESVSAPAPAPTTDGDVISCRHLGLPSFLHLSKASADSEDRLLRHWRGGEDRNYLLRCFSCFHGHINGLLKY